MGKLIKLRLVLSLGTLDAEAPAQFRGTSTSTYMPHDLPKAYDPTAIEDHWAEYWVREKLFAQPTPKRRGSAWTASPPLRFCCRRPM